MQEEFFFVALALCHTVHVTNDRKSERTQEIDGGNINLSFEADQVCRDYQASSPDEKALVEACRRYLIICSHYRSIFN